MAAPKDWGLSEQHYRIRGRELAEAMPDRCPSGHPLGRDTVLIGNHPCVKCTGSSHRTWRCRLCVLDLARLRGPPGLARVGRHPELKQVPTCPLCRDRGSHQRLSAAL
jgi:hypothetical protein